MQLYISYMKQQDVIFKSVYCSTHTITFEHSVRGASQYVTFLLVEKIMIFECHHFSFFLSFCLSFFFFCLHGRTFRLFHDSDVIRIGWHLRADWLLAACSHASLGIFSRIEFGKDGETRDVGVVGMFSRKLFVNSVPSAMEMEKLLTIQIKLCGLQPPPPSTLPPRHCV